MRARRLYAESSSSETPVQNSKTALPSSETTVQNSKTALSSPELPVPVHSKTALLLREPWWIDVILFLRSSPPKLFFFREFESSLDICTLSTESSFPSVQSVDYPALLFSLDLQEQVRCCASVLLCDRQRPSSLRIARSSRLSPHPRAQSLRTLAVSQPAYHHIAHSPTSLPPFPTLPSRTPRCPTHPFLSPPPTNSTT